MGVVEIARLLGVSRQRVNRIMHIYPDFPRPVKELAMGRVWDQSEVEEWVKTHPRPPGRPKH